VGTRDDGDAVGFATGRELVKVKPESGRTADDP